MPLKNTEQKGRCVAEFYYFASSSFPVRKVAPFVISGLTPLQTSTGIFAKGRRVAPFGIPSGFDHVAIFIVPSEQPPRIHPEYFIFDFRSKRWTATLAAESDTHSCGGKLAAVINDDRDLFDGALFMEPLTRLYTREADNAAIQRLFQLELQYGNTLNYDCLPSPPDSYNSNSFAAGLLDAAGIFPPLTPASTLANEISYPGWTTPVPALFFQPH